MGSGGFQQGLKGRAALAISGRDFYRGPDAPALDHHRALRARFAAIRRIRVGGLNPLFAGTLLLPRLARLQSIRLVVPNRLSNSRWLRGQSPAWCPSLSLRQQVIPEPHPSASRQQFPRHAAAEYKEHAGQGLAVGHSRPPPRGRGAWGGNNSSRTAHDASPKMGFAIRYPTTTFPPPWRRSTSRRLACR